MQVASLAFRGGKACAQRPQVGGFRLGQSLTRVGLAGQRDAPRQLERGGVASVWIMVAWATVHERRLSNGAATVRPSIARRLQRVGRDVSSMAVGRWEGQRGEAGQ